MSGERLMENAGAACRCLPEKTIDPEDKNCILFCGRGNNRGDGFVVARKLYEDGAKCGGWSSPMGSPAPRMPKACLTW